MNARRLCVSFAVLLLVPATVTAGAEEAPSGPAPPIEIDRSSDLAKVSSHLLQARALVAAGATTADVTEAVPVLQLASGTPQVEIRFWELSDQTIRDVERLGFRSIGVFPEHAIMTGSVDLDLLDEIAALDDVAVVHPLYEALPAVGLVTSQADVSIRAALARSEFGVDGTGVTIGVISDSFNVSRAGTVTGSGCDRTVSGMDNQLSGDLPAAAVLLDDGSGGGTDEGAAMAELIHDLAPGADIIFHSSNGGESVFATGIDELRACGADVIVDDVKYPTEPFFQDGVVAQAAQAAVDAGVPYFSSLGNYADNAIADDYEDADAGSDNTVLGDDFADFGGGDRFASLVVPANSSVRLLLQWNQPFSGSLGSGAAVDLNLYLFSDADPASTVLDSDTTLQGCSAAGSFGDPFEIVAYTNYTASDETVYLAVDHDCGSEDTFYRVVAVGGTDFESDIFDDYSTWGHAVAEGVHAVAAVDYREIDSGGSFSGGSAIDVESYSSLGGDIPIYFDETGNPLPGAPITRFKPQLAAPDKTNTTFFSAGYDPDGDGFPNFPGTSAAAPHAAAVAVLILDENPALTPAHVAAVLQSSTIDIEGGGVDPLSGYGLVDARDAVAAASAIDLVKPSWPEGSTVTISAITGNGATASWNAANDNVGVTGYRVYLNGALMATTPSTSVDITSLNAATTYGVRVEAIDAAGNESDTGPSANFTTTDSQPPTWPPGSSVTIDNVTATSAQATWTPAQDNSGSVSYQVYLDGELEGSTANTGLMLSGLSPGTTYAVQVEAVDGSGNATTNGPTAGFTTDADAPPTWPPGSTVTISAVTATSAVAAWGPASDDRAVASYNVYLDGAPAGSTSSLSYSLTALAPETSYTVQIKAVDDGGNESATGPSAGFATLSPLPPGGSFADDNGNVHEANIEAIAAAGITLGCNPPVNDRYCPDRSVTRGQMAAFLVRAMGLIDDGGGNLFVDDDGSVFEADIAKLAAAGITLGCNPPLNDRYCPNRSVTRGQMAAFLVRALGLTDDGGGNSFVDDDGSVFETDIAKLVQGGITLGCNPPVNDRYCPDKSVTRAQMASFLARALELDPIVPPVVSTFGDGIWLVPQEVPPGTYRNSDSSQACYWARLRGFGGELDDIITNEFTYEVDIVTIEAGDVGFESERCGTWSTDLSPRTKSPTESFGGGTFQVGMEVAPGLWRNSDSSDSCYWERLAGFDGSLSDIIENGFSDSIQTVAISPSDVGFSSSRCGTWSKIG